MAYFDVTTAMASVLKVRYPEDKIADLAYRQQAILPYLNKIRRKIGGKNYSFTIKTHRGNDTQGFAEDGTMITPTQDAYTRGYVDPLNVVTKQLIYQSAISDSADPEGSLFSALVDLPKCMAKNHGFFIANQAWAIDSLGALAKCGTTSASSTVVLSTTANTRKIYRGMIIDVCTASSGAESTSAGSLTVAQVSGMTTTTRTLSVSTTTVTTGTTESIYTQDSHSSTTPYVWFPIPYLVGTGTVCNITTSTTTPEYVSYTATCGTLTLAKIQAMVDEIEAKHEAGNDGLMLFMSPETIIKYADILVPDIRYKPEDLGRMEGGYPTTLFFRGGSLGVIPIIKDNLMPTDEIYCLSTNALRLFCPAWFQWFDLGGSRLVPNTGSNPLGYELKFFSRGNMAIVDRSGTGVLTGVTL